MTLRTNRPQWAPFVHEMDLQEFAGKLDARRYRGLDLLAGGLPCPPFSVAGKQLGHNDERNLFPVALDLVEAIKPRAVMFENVRGILDAVFEDFRGGVQERLRRAGYVAQWYLVNASDFGVPQLRPRVVFVGIRKDLWPHFSPPTRRRKKPASVGEVLYPLMSSAGWRGAEQWRDEANEIAPTIVGGSKKHGGPDLGPTRARKAWAALGVNGLKIADVAPPRDYVGLPHLTVPMVALLQGFPASWNFFGKKTAAYRQVGNAFPPPVAAAMGRAIKKALSVDLGQLSLLEHDIA
jgi:DNA (cytosine-5)-methyltransferase 1